MKYSLSDIKRKLSLREEELEILNSQQPSSLPQTTNDQRLREINALQVKVQDLKVDILQS